MINVLHMLINQVMDKNWVNVNLKDALEERTIWRIDSMHHHPTNENEDGEKQKYIT